MNGRFQILLRRRQNQFEGNDVIVQCNPITDIAEYVPGTVDNISSYAGIIPVDGWYDFTNFVENVEKLTFTWDKINSGNITNAQTNQDGSNYDKGLTSDLLFFDSGFQFIYDWLATNECQILNAVEVKIIDLIAGGSYRLFEIKSDNLEYAPVDDPCQFSIKLREQDNTWHCIHKTFIWDDWQGWFKTGNKDHPCFLTCIEPRPRLVQSARMGLLLFVHSNPIAEAIDFITGFSINEHARRILNANRFVDAPLIRTYIENVAGKCGLDTDTIFDEGEDWEDVCLYFPQDGFMHESEDDDIQSPSLQYHFDNRWLITIAELFDKLKGVFAAEWYVTPNNTIVFRHIKDLINVDPIYDFTADDAVPIYDLRYTFNGTKKPAYGRYEYQDDGSDLASQEISTLYSDIIDYDGSANNPMLEGERRKNFEFAPTGFVRDGRAEDYMDNLIDDGTLVANILIAAVFAIGFTLGPIGLVVIGLTLAWKIALNSENNELQENFRNNPVYDGAVRLTSEQVLTPRLLLWDGLNLSRAKVVKETHLPNPNTFYNPDSIAYNIKNRIDRDNPDLNLYNYPLYFDGDFTNNLFDRYHDTIDNPLKSLESHQDAKWNVDLCEDMLNLFGVFENQYAQIGKVVKLEERNNYSIYVRIGNISVDYDNNKINLRGVVLRRKETPVVPITCDTFEINTRCLIINGSYININ